MCQQYIYCKIVDLFYPQFWELLHLHTLLGWLIMNEEAQLSMLLCQQQFQITQHWL